MACLVCKSTSNEHLDCLMKYGKTNISRPETKICYECLMKLKTLEIYVKWPELYERIYNQFAEELDVLVRKALAELKEESDVPEEHSELYLTKNMNELTKAMEEGIKALHNRQKLEKQQREAQLLEDKLWEIK